jgi:hypothetical protein
LRQEDAAPVLFRARIFLHCGKVICSNTGRLLHFDVRWPNGWEPITDSADFTHVAEITNIQECLRKRRRQMSRSPTGAAECF